MDRTRPPLGVRPLWLIAEQRVDDLLRAVGDYVAAGRQVPVEWLHELATRVAYLNERNWRKAVHLPQPDYLQQFVVEFEKGKWHAKLAPGQLDSCSATRVVEAIEKALDDGFPEGPEAYEDALSLD